MPVSNELLEYQKVDAGLRKIEQEIASTEERKKYLQARKIMKAALDRLDSLDRHAAELIRLRDDLSARVEATSKGLEEYEDIDELLEGGADVGFYKKNAQTLLDRLRSVKAELNRLLGEIDKIAAEYKKLMEQGRQANKQYKENKEKADLIEQAHDGEIKALKGKLREIGKTIDPKILELYSMKRKEGIFPVVVPLTDWMCVCGVELPLLHRSELAGGNMIECEHCRRLIYKA